MQYYNIELIEEYDKVNFYSIHLSDSELSEFEDFFDKFPVAERHQSLHLIENQGWHNCFD